MREETRWGAGRTAWAWEWTYKHGKQGTRRATEKRDGRKGEEYRETIERQRGGIC